MTSPRTPLCHCSGNSVSAPKPRSFGENTAAGTDASGFLCRWNLLWTWMAPTRLLHRPLERQWAHGGPLHTVCSWRHSADRRDSWPGHAPTDRRNRCALLSGVAETALVERTRDKGIADVGVELR